MLISMFDVDGLVHRQFVPPARTVKQQFVLNVLKRLRESLRQKHAGKWQSGD
jgi:hypothetical protein